MAAWKRIVFFGAWLTTGAVAWVACTSSPAPEIGALPPPPRTVAVVAPPPPDPPASAEIPEPPPPEEDSTDVEICQEPGPPPSAKAPEEAKILHAICPKGVDPPHPKKDHYACLCCAPFGCCGPDSGMRTGERYAVRQLITGSFMHAGAREAFAIMDGCEPYAGNYGGAVLLQMKGQSWEMVRYHSAYNPNDCKAIPRKDGRDTLACLWVTGKMVPSYYIYALTFDEKGKIVHGPEQDGHLFEIYDTTSDACAGSDEISFGNIRDLTAADINKDGWKDITVKLEVALGFKPSAAWKKAHCEFEPQGAKKTPVPEPKMKQVSIDFLFDGERFKIAPGSADIYGHFMKPARAEPSP